MLPAVQFVVDKLSLSLQVPAGVAYSNYTMSQKPGDNVTTNPKSPGFTISRLLTSGIYIPLSEALLMFYQVCASMPDSCTHVCVCDSVDECIAT